MIPIRCFSCGKPIGHLYEEYKEKTKNNPENKAKVLDDLEIDRFCCRQVFLTHVELINLSSKFKKN
ncbi:MAG: DNA-directed RNA polymerase subunit N [Candidatus Woesearchaeota archaeon]